MQAMILAAGLGSRMRPLTDHTPKPLLRVAGKPLLEHQIERLICAGADSVVINVSYLAGQICDFIASRNWPVPVRLSHEDQPLETAGGIQHARQQGLLNSHRPLLLVNGDIWCDFDLKQLPATLPSGHLAHLLLTRNPEHNPQGDFLLTRDGQVLRKPAGNPADSPYQTATFSGISLLHPDLIPSPEDAPPPLALGPLLKAAADKGAVSGQLHTGYWLDVGTPERLQQLERYLNPPQ